MGTIIYFVKEAVRGLYNAKLMTVVSILSIGISLFLMAIICIAFLNIEILFQKSTDSADLALYLEDKVASDTSYLNEVRKKIQEIPEVKKVYFIDKDSAWKRFSQIYGKEMLSAIDENPLPASFEVYLNVEDKTEESVKKVAELLKNISNIESVRYSLEWVNIVKRFRIVFISVVFISAILLNFFLYFMISNTIKLTIYARKEIIFNMQMVGATPLFIKMPFLIEGLLQGLLGGIICIGILFSLRLSLLHFPIYWGDTILLPLTVILIGVIYGWIGSTGAVKKFLR